MKPIIYLYWLVALLHLAGEWLELAPLVIATKPLLMIILGAWYYFATSPARTPTHKMLLAAFAFAWAGDILLMGSETFFLPGLVAFLITHTLYILAFRKEIISVPGTLLIRKNPLTALPVLLLSAGLLMLLFNAIQPEMKIPVIVYALVITLMVIVAMNRYGKVTAMSFRMVVGGALLFMFSDSLIAVNKFYQSVWHAGFFIMLLYVTGQYLIARGTVKT